MESEIRTDKNPRGLAFSGILRYDTEFWIQESILPECLPGPLSDCIFNINQELKYTLTYAQFYKDNCQIPFHTNNNHST